MTVKKRLILNVALTVGGIALILAVSIFATLKIRSSVYMLTGKSTPLQVKTLELQQMIEKISANLMHLGLSISENEVRQISGNIEKDVTAIERINKEIQALSTQTSRADVDVFRGIYKSVIQDVDRKISSAALFRTETGNVNAAFKKVEEALSAIKENIDKLNINARGVVTAAQESSMGLNSTIKKLLTVQLILKDIKMSILEIDTIKNKYKLSPLKERVKALSGSVQSVNYGRGEPEIIRESKDVIIRVCEQMLRDGGLIAVKAASLMDGNNDAYASQRGNINSSLDAINSKMTEFIDGFEIRIVKENENMESSRRLAYSADVINDTGNSINADIKELNSGVRLVMLSLSSGELDSVVANVGRTREKVVKNIHHLKTVLKQARQDSMLKNSDLMIKAMDSVGMSIEKIIKAKKDVLSSDAAMQKSMEDIKAVSMKQSMEGQQQVKSISQKQQEVVRNVGNTVSASMTFMVVASLLILAAVVLANAKTMISIIKPLKATEEMIEAVEKGDLTREMQVDGNDEIAQMCRSFNGLVKKLHDAMSHIASRSQIINRQVELISGTIEHQAAFSTQLSSSVVEISSTMEELSSSSTQIADYTDSVVSVANKSWKDTKEGAVAVETITMKMNDINIDNQDNIKEIVELGKKSKEITKIMGIINNIADQTKLIAFNAALEASSAGEAGKRFGVVAVEIRRLADNVMESTGEIESKINEILEAVNRLVVASEKGSKVIQEGVDYATQTVSMLIDIVNVAEETDKSAKQISLSTQQQKSASNQVAVALREIVAGVRQTSDSIGQINDVSKELEALSDDLRGLVDKFTLKS